MNAEQRTRLFDLRELLKSRGTLTAAEMTEMVQLEELFGKEGVPEGYCVVCLWRWVRDGGSPAEGPLCVSEEAAVRGAKEDREAWARRYQEGVL